MTAPRSIAVLAALLLVARVGLAAQPVSRVPHIGYLFFGAAGSDPAAVEGLRQGLREAGYVEHQNVEIDYRFAEGHPDRLANLLTELLDLKIDVLITQGTAASTAAKRRITATPVVFVALDPLGSGLVQSLARPGGNLTGLSFAQGEHFTGKWLGLLKETVPKATRIGILWNPTNPGNAVHVKEMEAMAPGLGVSLGSHPVRSADDIAGAFTAMARTRVAALIVLTDPILIAHRGQIVKAAADARIPTTYGVREFVDAGGLMSYGANLFDLWRRAALHVDKILKGAKPADLPVEQATKFELVLNLKAARALRLTIPPSVMLQADQVIE